MEERVRRQGKEKQRQIDRQIKSDKKKQVQIDRYNYKETLGEWVRESNVPESRAWGEW